MHLWVFFSPFCMAQRSPSLLIFSFLWCMYDLYNDTVSGSGCVTSTDGNISGKWIGWNVEGSARLVSGTTRAFAWRGWEKRGRPQDSRFWDRYLNWGPSQCSVAKHSILTSRRFVLRPRTVISSLFWNILIFKARVSHPWQCGRSTPSPHLERVVTLQRPVRTPYGSSLASVAAILNIDTFVLEYVCHPKYVALQSCTNCN